MFGIGTPELLVILVVALLVLGPKRLPEVARTLGKGLAELRKATSGLTDELNNARVLIEEEVRSAERGIKPKPAAKTVERAAADNATASAPAASAPAANASAPAANAPAPAAAPPAESARRDDD